MIQQMPHVSRNKLPDDVERELLHTLEIVLVKISREKDIDNFLLSLLTETEQIMLAKRFAVVLLLKEGLRDSEIAETLHVTRMTVSRLRYFSEAHGEGFNAAFSVLENEKLIEELKLSLLRVAGYIAKSSGGRV